MTLADLTRHIPAQAALSKILASRTHRSAGEYAGVLALGLIAGAALALLLAPKPGRELREELSEKVGGIAKSAKKIVANGYEEGRAAVSQS
jgi:uncharacterized membrane protein YebE (DUF533 family)